jgi:hypothetical protein
MEPQTRAPHILSRARLLLPLLLVAFDSEATAQPPDVLYSVRPGTTILACGGFSGGCRPLLLRGAVARNAGFGTVVALLEIAPLAGGDFGPIPASGDLQISDDLIQELAPDGSLTLRSPEGSSQQVDLRLRPIEDGLLLLSGTYDEGCCDRFVYDFGQTVLQLGGSPGALEFHGGRFFAVVEWEDAGGGAGQGRPLQLDSQSGLFWFFAPDNPEIFVKVLDACSISGRFWIFVAGLTDLGVRVSVFDRLNDYAYGFDNPVGRPFETAIETEGYPCLDL